MQRFFMKDFTGMIFPDSTLHEVTPADLAKTLETFRELSQRKSSVEPILELVGVSFSFGIANYTYSTFLLDNEKRSFHELS